MILKCKNWQLVFLFLLFFILFLSLGYWQLSRAQQKRVLLSSFQERYTHAPLHAKDLQGQKELHFYPIELTGYFDDQHTLLLDNKTFHGQVGYEIYTPFHVEKEKITLLVDRGFVPLGPSREIAPQVPILAGKTKIIGMLNKPPSYPAFGEMSAPLAKPWPLRIEYIDLTALTTCLGYTLYPDVLILKPSLTNNTDWQVSIISPERHQAYALQWFALAATLLILFVALYRKNKH